MNIILDIEIEVLYNKNTIVQIDPQRQTIIRSVKFPNFTIMSFLIYKNFLIMGTIDNLI